ncbi:ester cyclase [Leptolyngbya sp. FACHB-261]|uniref:ester cyclase n=1 Tax=Leptolyngbya sp. FACHB-261 TaxID=2692806 RepID=UPI001682EF38|nr:ester cyclase [Leptolyngbya sp. FACHB-261]MBD2102829.1 ester cyclase [Leptolyngbya sp. FACHB-261]
MTLLTLKQTAVRFYDAFNKRDLEALGQVLQPNWKIHPDLPRAGSDFEKYKPISIALLEAFPDVRFNVESTISEGDIVAVRAVITGTQQGFWFGAPASGKPIQIFAHDFHRLEDDRIAESWHVEDWLLGMRQIGALG